MSSMQCIRLLADALHVVCCAGHARINGEPYVLLDRSLHEVIKHIAKDLTGKIRLSWPVEAIEYSEAGAVVYGPGGARVKCAYVLVSARCCPMSLAFRAMQSRSMDICETKGRWISPKCMSLCRRLQRRSQCSGRAASGSYLLFPGGST